MFTPLRPQRYAQVVDVTHQQIDAVTLRQIHR
jgi:hypothetical protein